MPRGLLMLGLTLCLACETELSTVYVPAPESGSLLVAIVTPTHVSDIWAYEPGETHREQALLTPDDRLYRLEYDEALDKLELPAGRLTISGTGERALDAPTRVERRAVESDSAPWQEIQWPVEPLDSLRLALPRRSACQSLTSVPVTVSHEDSVIRTVLPLGGRQVLAFVSGGENYIVDPDGVTPVDLGLPTGQSIRGAHLDPSGEMWLVTRDAIYRGRLESGFVQTATGAFGDSARCAVTGPLGKDDPVELFVWTGRPELFRYSDGGVTRLAQLEASESKPHASMLWLAPGEVVAADARHLDFVHYVDARADVTETDAAFYSMQRMPDGELLSGADRGLVRTWRDGRWQTRYQLTDEFVFSLIPMPNGGILFGGQSGVMRQFYPEGGEICEPQVVLPNGTVAGHVEIDGGVVVYPRLSNDPAQVSFIFWSDGS